MLVAHARWVSIVRAVSNAERPRAGECRGANGRYGETLGLTVLGLFACEVFLIPAFAICSDDDHKHGPVCLGHS
jgi:hypothetical protein